jgi:hypothetical protein
MHRFSSLVLAKQQNLHLQRDFSCTFATYCKFSVIAGWLHRTRTGHSEIDFFTPTHSLRVVGKNSLLTFVRISVRVLAVRHVSFKICLPGDDTSYCTSKTYEDHLACLASLPPSPLILDRSPIKLSIGSSLAERRKNHRVFPSLPLRVCVVCISPEKDKIRFSSFFVFRVG